MTITPQSWTPDSGLVREVEDQFDRALASYRANAHLVSEHANHEESIRVGGYANRTLLELVQNAADAMSEVSDDQSGFAGRVEIVLDPEKRTLYCANAGRPFSRSGLTAITHAHLSGKRGDEIGRFGLGFKSVLAVSDAPQVFSRSVSFEFNSRTARAEIGRIASTAKRYPILRTPTVVDPFAMFAEDPILAGLAGWATSIVKLSHASNLERLRREMESFASEFLLFVGSVREVRLMVLGVDGFETSHTSRDFGGGVYKIETPNGGGDEWIVADRMHAPSAAARKEVGEAVSRTEVKVTVAIPKQQARQRVGRFWSYFPLQDQTSASALFNAPWSVNDDRTTLLKNDYNREILATLSDMFVEVLPQVKQPDDPAAHLDYMPARGREPLSFGDKLLCAHVPEIAASVGLVPDAAGTLVNADELRPLDFAVQVHADIHRAWTISVHTATDVPHWRCYTSPQRVTRLRQLFTSASPHGGIDATDRDMKRALEDLPKRGLLSWLREWADGPDSVSSSNAFKFVLGHKPQSAVEQAKVVPTTEGMRSLADRSVVFLHQEEGVEIEGAIFVSPDFLARPGVDEGLRRVGFRDLDPRAILNARLAALSSTSGDEELTKLWKAVVGLPPRDTGKALTGHPLTVKVPTKDGGWSWPHTVFDLPEPLGDEYAAVTLDRQRCTPEVAHELGVVRAPRSRYPAEDELALAQYREWVVATLNEAQGPGERPIENIDLLPGEGPGPFSMLPILLDSNASSKLREIWTVGLLEIGDVEWTCDDLHTGRTHTVPSPVRWAVDRAGLLQSTRGFRTPAEIVAPSLVRYEKLLPLFRGPRRVAETLGLPDELEAVPPQVLREALAAELFPSNMEDDLLVEFITTASRIAHPGGRPPSIPARVKRATESRSPASVYLATTDDQQDFLSSRQRPYLRVTDAQALELIASVGCRRFEDSFAFSMVIAGEQESERVLDLFTGLRNTHVARSLTNATVTRAIQVVKRVTTEDGVEDQPLPWHLDGAALVVRDDVGERGLLGYINEAFELRLTNADLENVLRTGLDHRLQGLQQEALAAATDAERLDVYFGPDDLRDALPKGLWQALETQGLLDGNASVSELFLTVHGSDSVKELAHLFRQEGFPDVPNAWAGSANTISWLRSMGFGTKYAGRRSEPQEHEFIVPGAVKLDPLHQFQKRISQQLKDVLVLRDANGRHLKAMVELPTGAGKTRVAAETVLRLFIEGGLRGPVLWIAQSLELCEQAVQTWTTVWRGLADERPLTVGRLWERNAVHEPDTEFSLIVATDAKLDVILGSPEYAWLANASTVIIDEGHRAGGSERYTRILEWLGVAGRGWARPLVGLSATPFKGTSDAATKALANRFGNRKLDAFGSDAYKQLADLEVLARVEHQVLDGIDVQLLPEEITEATEQRRISPRVMERIGQDQARMATLVNHIMGLDEGWPVLVFTPNVLSAQVLAATLRYRGVAAAAVSGQTGRQERRDIIAKFKRNEIRVLANCDLLIQGFDAPGVRALYIARPTFSPNAYIQMAGRGLRGPANGGKPECLIVDMADNFGDVNELLGYREYEDLWKEQRA
ncbi:sacsin N-terminal ATP-binding-like domain-containing protein [Streptomyces sp. NBC_00385]|uniref:sacsin N-terminal ATP-binding-like domain-containing protein n=1 Tax=Streptomyces sp. NBC_00385 TaxID=2975733 RepID=UPI002DD83D84|nr:DEAD/DEAH box helicase family protein [Streptomyces sp. NBC_00385]WRZ06862.1 DEAD/DEAH box helicase family protein [Streptomyces sp. NBC_00385]